MATIEQLNNIKQIIEGVDGFSIRTSTPSKIVVNGQTINMAKINYLCI